MLTSVTRNFEFVEHNRDEKDIFHITVKKNPKKQRIKNTNVNIFAGNCKLIYNLSICKIHFGLFFHQKKKGKKTSFSVLNLRG